MNNLRFFTRTYDRTVFCCRLWHSAKETFRKLQQAYETQCVFRRKKLSALAQASKTIPAAPQPPYLQDESLCIFLLPETENSIQGTSFWDARERSTKEHQEEMD